MMIIALIHSIGDFYYNGVELFAIAGANSIDKYHRIEGRDWFREEELDYSTFQSAIDFACDELPKIMVTHDCPQFIRKTVFNINEHSRTSDALDVLYEELEVKPQIWIFGHHHKNVQFLYEDTLFVCGKPNTTYELLLK